MPVELVIVTPVSIQGSVEATARSTKGAQRCINRNHVYEQGHKLPYPLLNFNKIFKTHLTVVLILSVDGYYNKKLPCVTGRKSVEWFG